MSAGFGGHPGFLQSSGGGGGTPANLLPGTAAGGLASLLPGMALGRSGGKIVLAGDSLVQGNGGLEYSITQPLVAKLGETFRIAGYAPAVFANIAAGGNTTHDIWVTGLAAIQANLAIDGQDLVVNGSINDVLQFAGNDGLGPWTQPQAVSFVQSGIVAVLGSKPNTRIWVIGPAWANAENYTISATGQPIGAGTLDAAVRSMDLALAQACALFPQNVRYISLVNGIYRSALTNNPTNATNSVLTLAAASPHPSQLGVRVIGDIMFQQIPIAGHEAPPTLIPSTRFDASDGDWVREGMLYCRRHCDSGNAPSAATNPGVLNKFQRILIAGAVPAAFTDGSKLGGGWQFAGATQAFLTPNIYPSINTTNWAFGLRATFTAIGAGSSAYVGGVGAAVGTTAYIVGQENALSATKWVRRETNATVSSTFVSTVNFTSGVPITMYFIHQVSDVGNNIYDVLADSGPGTPLQSLFHVNPSANIPLVALALAAALCAGGANVTIHDGFYMWNE